MRTCSIAAEGRLLIANARIATSFVARARGMIGRRFGSEWPALVLEPCRSIHTFGMRGPLDAVFYDRSRRVVRIVEGLEPLRGAVCARARGVVELPAGQARALALEENMSLAFEDPESPDA
jgi:uncharacterized membrane protein (UPF0127 family)